MEFVFAKFFKTYVDNNYDNSKYGLRVYDWYQFDFSSSYYALAEIYTKLRNSNDEKSKLAYDILEQKYQLNKFYEAVQKELENGGYRCEFEPQSIFIYRQQDNLPLTIEGKVDFDKIDGFPNAEQDNHGPKYGYNIYYMLPLINQIEKQTKRIAELEAENNRQKEEILKLKCSPFPGSKFLKAKMECEKIFEMKKTNEE